VKFWGWVPYATLSTIKDEARRCVEEGFDCLYLKVGLDRNFDVESVKAIRDAVGYGVDLRIDANQAWTPSGAIRMIKKMEQYDLEFVEQPVLMYNLDALARVRAAVSTPILSHESSWTFHDTLNVLKRDAADAVQLDPRFDEGVWGFRVAAGMAEAAGIGAVAHSFGELGVATAFAIHAIASSPAFVYANQTAYSFLADDVIKDGMMKFEKGHLNVPEKLGLGVELDSAKVEKYSKVYDQQIRGKEFQTPWQSPRKFLGLKDGVDDWVPMSAQY
jgi:L-alanine-DL-glutamate epimerase-like enolase superfamily enzyme